MQATANTVLQAETMSGDLRDALLTHVRSMETPWSKLSERQQADKIDAIQHSAETLVRKAVSLVANQGFPHLSIRLGKWSVNGEMKLEVSGAGSVDNITKLAEHGAGEAILVLTEVGEYFGQRQAAKAEPDQPGLPIDETDEAAGDEETLDASGDAPADPDAPEAGTELPAEERQFTADAEEPVKRSRRRSTIRENEPA